MNLVERERPKALVDDVVAPKAFVEESPPKLVPERALEQPDVQLAVLALELVPEQAASDSSCRSWDLREARFSAFRSAARGS